MEKGHVCNQEVDEDGLTEKQQPVSYRKQLQTLNQYLQQTKDYCRKLNSQILTQFSLIQTELSKKEQKNKQQQQIYLQSLEPQYHSQKIVNLAMLSKYLNSQKTLLKQILSQNQDTQSKSPSTLLHNLLKRKRYQTYLQEFQQKKIEAEIQFLQKNIMISNGILYQNMQTFTQAEDDSIKLKIQAGLLQLQRIINLSNTCEGYQNKQAKLKNRQIVKQAKRLQQIDNLLNKQYQSLKELKQFGNKLQNNFKPLLCFLNKAELFSE